MNHNFSEHIQLFFQSFLMQTKNWDSQQVLSSFCPFPETAKKPLCVEHHIFLTGQLRSGIFSVPWLKLTKGSNEVFFAKPRLQQRVQRAQLFHSKTTKHVHFPKDLYVTGRKGCGQAMSCFGVSHVRESEQNQPGHILQILSMCLLYPAGNTESCLEHELSCPICSVLCLSPSIAMATPCCP